MFNRARSRLLPLLRVPADPHPPSGAPGSVRVFRAAKNYYRLLLALWALRQLMALFGIAFSLLFLARIQMEADRAQTALEHHAAANSGAIIAPSAEPTSPSRSSRGPEQFIEEFSRNPEQAAAHIANHAPWWLFPLIAVLEVAGILFYLVQLPITYALVRLQFESHWYIVTDRSLRIRNGLFSMQETTMSFANVQQVTVSQGPLQRLLSIADVRVQSAGGGSGGNDRTKSDQHSMHTGVFHGVADASEIRDLILERLRQFRATGLGDPDDHREAASSAPPALSHANDDLLRAANELLTAARALRHPPDAPA